MLLKQAVRVPKAGFFRKADHRRRNNAGAEDVIPKIMGLSEAARKRAAVMVLNEPE